MKHLTINHRIALLATALSLCCAGIVTYNLWSLRNLDRSYSHIVSAQVPKLGALAQILAGLGEGQRAVLDALQQTEVTAREEVHAGLQDTRAGNQAAIATMEKLLDSAEDRAAFESLVAQRKLYNQHAEQTFQLALADQMTEAFAYNRTHTRPAYFAYRKLALEFAAALQAQTDTANAALSAAAASRFRLVFAIGVCVVAASAVIGIVFARQIRRALARISETLRAGAEQTAAAAAQVSAASQSLAGGASEQAASLEETSATIEEIASMTKRNADSADAARTTAADAQQAADHGMQRMQEMQGAMDAIKASSDSIANIVKNIDQIAFQTNILALNAAVEAARAGDAGAGFAVVADEVRALAQRSAEAARETATRIEDSIRKSNQGVALSAQVSESLQQIAGKTRHVNQLVLEISTASREQTGGVAQINTAIAQMDKVTQSNAAAAEESASAAEELNAQAEELRTSVARLQQLIGRSSITLPADEEPDRGAELVPATPRAPDSTSAKGSTPGFRSPAITTPKHKTPRLSVELN